MQFSRSLVAKVGAAALVLAAAGTASVAHAGDRVHFSVGAHIAPGVVLNASNAPYYYYGPRYVPAPVYYYAPPPVYYAPPPVYYRPATVIVGGHWHGHGHRHWHKRHKHRNW
jgi:hypothetical protein